MYNNMINNRYSIPTVKGFDGAKAFPMSINSGILLLDEDDDIVWLKTTDSGGYANVKGYTLTPLKTQEEEMNDKYEILNNRLDKLEEMLTNGQFNIKRNKSNKRFSKSNESQQHEQQSGSTTEENT